MRKVSCNIQKYYNYYLLFICLYVIKLKTLWKFVEACFLFYLNKCGHRNVLSKRQVWMSIFHIVNFKKKKKSWTQGPGLFLLKVRSCVFIANFHHSLPPPPKGYKIVSLIINL